MYAFLTLFLVAVRAHRILLFCLKVLNYVAEYDSRRQKKKERAKEVQKYQVRYQLSTGCSLIARACEAICMNYVTPRAQAQ